MAGEPFYGPDYEAMVDWEARLANELPFFEQLFKERAIRRVADVACGTGRHAIAFAKWGLEVVGADPSTELLHLGRQAATEEGVDVTFVQADFLRLADRLPGPFDAIICIGNSLPHLLSGGEVRCALEQMAVLLIGRGTLVVQERSAERIWTRGDHLLGPRLVEREGEKLVFQRMVEAHPPTTTLNIIRLSKKDGGWDLDVKSTELRPIRRDEMQRLLSDTGFETIAAYGDYNRNPFDPSISEDLLVVAEQAGGEES